MAKLGVLESGLETSGVERLKMLSVVRARDCHGNRAVTGITEVT